MVTVLWHFKHANSGYIMPFGHDIATIATRLLARPMACAKEATRSG